MANTDARGENGPGSPGVRQEREADTDASPEPPSAGKVASLQWAGRGVKGRHLGTGYSVVAWQLAPVPQNSYADKSGRVRFQAVSAPLDIRWKQRFQNFDRAFVLLRQAMENGPAALNPLEKEGVIQRFEYCFELAWKTVKDYLEAGGLTFAVVTPRQVLKDIRCEGNR